ncbi:MAG: hypothetical protein ACLTV1_08695 [Christensenellales bacterium]
MALIGQLHPIATMLVAIFFAASVCELNHYAGGYWRALPAYPI